MINIHIITKSYICFHSQKNVSDSSKPDIDPIEYYNKIASELKAKKAKIKMGEEEDL